MPCLSKYCFYSESSQLTGESRLYTKTLYTSERTRIASLMALLHIRAPVLAINSKAIPGKTLKPTVNLKPTTHGWPAPLTLLRQGFSIQPRSSCLNLSRCVLPKPGLLLTSSCVSLIDLHPLCPSSKFRQQLQIHIQTSPKLLQLWRAAPKCGPEGGSLGNTLFFQLS